MKSFLELKKTKKVCSKVKHHGADPNLLTIMTNFLAIFVLSSNLSFLDRDPDSGGKLNADSYGSGSTALVIQIPNTCYTVPMYLGDIFLLPLNLLFWQKRSKAKRVLILRIIFFLSARESSQMVLATITASSNYTHQPPAIN